MYPICMKGKYPHPGPSPRKNSKWHEEREVCCREQDSGYQGSGERVHEEDYQDMIKKPVGSVKKPIFQKDRLI